MNCGAGLSPAPVNWMERSMSKGALLVKGSIEALASDLDDMLVNVSDAITLLDRQEVLGFTVDPQVITKILAVSKALTSLACKLVEVMAMQERFLRIEDALRGAKMQGGRSTAKQVKAAREKVGAPPAVARDTAKKKPEGAPRGYRVTSRAKRC